MSFRNSPANRLMPHFFLLGGSMLSGEARAGCRFIERDSFHGGRSHPHCNRCKSINLHQPRRRWNF